MKILKSILEFLAIVAYIPGTTYLCYTVGMPILGTVLGPLRFRPALFSIWVGLIAAGALVLLLRGRKVAGCFMVAATFAATVISIALSGTLPGI